LNQPITLKNAYHRILRFEYSKYEEIKSLQKVFFTLSELQEKEKLPDNIIRELQDRGFIVKIGDGKYRSLLMDVAARISDIRIKYGGTKYVLESELTLKPRPFLNWNYVEFDKPSKELEKLKEAFCSVVPSEYAERFLKILTNAGIKGLSKYQYLSIIEFLRDNRDTVISAPTAFGKTYIFVIPILLAAIKAKLENKKGTVAVIFYPRKSLESDQMGRLVRLVYLINREFKLNITIGIDDGNVKARKDLKDFEEYRGIKCPVHPKEKLVVKQKKIYCEKCNDFLDFICLSREDFIKNPPTILITNVWAYQYKLSDERYWRNDYLSPNIEYFVFDEVHAYRSISAGVLKYFIQILRSLVSKNARLILSSATIPKLDEFVQDISSKEISQLLKLVYDESVYGKDSEKIELYLLLGINPLTSWETFTHELAIFLSTVNRIRKQKNLQSLIFVDSIRNISRLYSQALEAIKLGDPRDHLLQSIPAESPYCYWVYNEEYKLIEQKEESKLISLQNDIEKNIETHYSDKSDRFEIEEKIKSGNIDVVFTTSTLELGVDYDKVSVVVNVGIPFALESIIQRVGRAGRDEYNTLHTSLSVIVVRNNPLEYFYIYKGINEITEIENLPKIPVASSNLFVVFYSVLLYIVAYLTKNGNPLKEKEEQLEKLKKITETYFEIKDRAIKDLGIKLDLSEMEKTLNNITELLKDQTLMEKIELIRKYENKNYLENELSSIISEIKQTLSSMKEKISEVPEREKPIFEKEIESLETLISQKGSSNLSILNQSIYDIIKIIDDLKNYIRSDLHPMHKFRRSLSEYSHKLESHKDDISKLAKIENPLGIKSEDFSIYFKAKEVNEALKENPIRLIESIIGFKFMGNEFIDQAVDVGVEFQPPTERKEMYFNNIVSRTPPFEVVTVPFERKEDRDVTRIVGARHFWFVKPKGFYIEPYKDYASIYHEVDETGLGKGKAEKFRDLVIPQEINFIDILALEKPFIIKMTAKDNKPFFIKYGSGKISESKIDGKFPLYSNIKKLYSPFNQYYSIIMKRTIDHLKYLDKELQKKGNKWGANLRYPAFCYLGYCISTDPFDNVCPVQEECNLLCDGKKYWSAAMNKRKIFPKIFLNQRIRNLPDLEPPLFIRLGTITYDELRKDIEFIYDSIAIYLPRFFGDYLLREIEVTPIGYLARTSLVYLCFNDDLIKLFIDTILEDSEILELLKFKYFMFQEFKKFQSSIDAATRYSRYDPKKINEKTEEFYKFVHDCLIHTIAHLFFLFLVNRKVQVDPEKLTYFIKNSTIYILENSKSDGMGLVETIRAAIEQNGENELIREFIEWSLNFLKKHEEHIERVQSMLQQEAQDSLEKLKTSKIFEKVRKLQNEIRKLNNDISLHVNLNYVDIVTYRHILSHKLTEWEEYEDELSEYILPLIHIEGKPKLCVDGCEDCLIFYRGCTQPFIQNYTISKLLALKFLELIKRGNYSILGKNLGTIVEKLMEKSDKVTIKVPFIDEYGYKLLTNMKGNRKICIITRKDNPYAHKLMSEGIEVKIMEDLHGKRYCFETKTEEICIHGSLNLTYSSFYEKDENISITWEPSEVKKIKRDMEESE